jgi:predicted helicase
VCTVGGIPDAAHDYVVGSRTALDWLIDRYQVKTDKASGIVNDPNDWCDEHDDPTYIVELIKKVTTVSVRTVELVQQLAT